MRERKLVILGYFCNDTFLYRRLSYVRTCRPFIPHRTDKQAYSTDSDKLNSKLVSIAVLLHVRYS
jgi:hypothetical protein